MGSRQLVLAPLALAIGLAWPGLAAGRDGPPREVDYQREVRPILARNCFNCHGNDAEQRAAGLRLDQQAAATAELKSGSVAIVPGDPDSSDLVFRITELDPTVRMPPPKAGDALKPAEVETLTRWIAQGAKYSEHWAFVPPSLHPAPLPAPEGPQPNGPADAWIQQAVRAAGLTQQPEADRPTLLRRLSIDLRGLPPTPAELERFLADESPAAYEKWVDRYLADPAYGERWARIWLDLARYADSAGYGSDPLRPNMWRYRDWVIDAFNQNKPYDRFSRDQLAGDLLLDPSLEQRIATAFHRNTMTNTEGGTDDEEFRAAAVKDRVDTTGQVFLGLTVGCAKCHTHKYDPISQTEYYQLYAVFDQTADNDQANESPTLAAPTARQQAELDEIEKQLAAANAQLMAADPALDQAQADWEARLREAPVWTTRAPISLESEGGTALAVSAEGAISATGPNPAPQSYWLDLGPVDRVAAVRLETLPSPDLPAGGAGRAADGNFVLSHLELESRPTDPRPPVVARTVRIALPGPNRILSLAEVQVFSRGKNVARTGRASQSSTDYQGAPERAIDGNPNGDYQQAQSTTHTLSEESPWWQVDLPEAVPIERVVVWNRTDGGTSGRLAGFTVQILDDQNHAIWTETGAAPPSPAAEFSPIGLSGVGVSRATADFSQANFPIESAIAPRIDTARGWAVQPGVGQPHTAIFLLKSPTLERQNLNVRLDFAFRDPGYTLGRWRIATTDSAVAAERLNVPAPILAAIDAHTSTRSEEDTLAVRRYFRSQADATRPLREAIARLEASRPVPPNVPVMVELPAEKRRVSRLLNKGNFLDPGDPVSPALPRAFGNPPATEHVDRLVLADWLFDPSNTLTARVAANRVWAQLFGIGLVETEEDFGTQGELPSHPELLDTLAIAFRESGWDFKRLLRGLVETATYRQGSRVTEKALAVDPRNRLLSHAPRFRLDAEQVRDQALALSGLLSRKLGGPSVFPPQPDGLWQAAFNGERTWSTSAGNDRHRRGLYTFWRRTVPYPSMATFDAPSREICAVRRIRTNTPLQAFVTLNDPAYVEAAQGLARRLMREGGDSPESRARLGLALCLGRPADDRQVAVIVQLFEAERARFQADAEAATAFATEPIGPVPAGLDTAELAAWTSVANVLLNLDGVLTRG